MILVVVRRDTPTANCRREATIAMTPDQYFGRSKGSFPEAGVVGSESEWMDMGGISVPHGTLWVGDLYAMEGDVGCSVITPKGRYRVQIKGMDFKGHRRPSRIRAFQVSAPEFTVGRRCGAVTTDCGLLGLYDSTAFQKTVGAKHAKKYGQDVMSATMEQIVGCVGLKYAGKEFELAFLPSGLGDGTFAVYPLECAGKPVGIEVELLAPGFKVGK